MSHLDTTTLTNVLKRVYGSQLVDLATKHVMTYNQFQLSNRKAAIRPGGAGYYFGLRQSDLENVGARGEGQFIPQPLDYAAAQGVILPKLLYSVIRMSGLLIEAGKGNAEAFVNTLGDATTNAFKSLTVDMNRQCHGDGFGLLGTVDSDTTYTQQTDATFTVGFNNDLGTRYMRKGMVVDFYKSNGAIDTTAYPICNRIASINPVTRRVTFEANSDAYGAYHPNSTLRGYTPVDNTTIAAASQMVRYGARDAAFATTDTPYEMIGLLGHYDDGTLLATHEGLLITTYPEFKANILSNSSVNRELSIDLMLAAMDMTLAQSGENATLIRMGLGQRRKYFGLLEGDIRFAPTTLVGGYEKLGFSQNTAVQIMVDPMTQPNKLFFEPDGIIKKYELTPIGWGGFDPNKMHWRQDYDEATMFLRTYTNLGVENRPALTLLSDLTEPDKITMPF